MANLTTDPKWAINQDDIFELLPTDIALKRSRSWKKKAGDTAIVKDGKFRAKGTVLGFNSTIEPGRVMIVQTSPKHFVFIDAFTAGYQVIG